ncbi:hypothetical protein [Arenimonas sp.]|uniref:hypothetical protein n=1 Tax=Arenimonas sp. TaxID=1872635 RepID=UPI0039E4D618
MNMTKAKRGVQRALSPKRDRADLEQNWRLRLYGRISGGQVESYLAMLNEIWSGRSKMFDGLSEQQLKNGVTKLAEIPNWVGFYQLSLVQLIAYMLVESGFKDELLRAAQSDDPISVVTSLIESLPEEAPEGSKAIPAAFAMIGNLDSISRYSRSINDLLRDAREKQDVGAIFKALSVDSYISTLPAIQVVMRMGQMAGDGSFAEVVFKAIRGPHKKRQVYETLRWAEYLLRDQGAFLACSQDDIHDLIVNRLHLYDDDTKKKDSKKALFMLFRKWQKEAGN